MIEIVEVLYFFFVFVVLNYINWLIKYTTFRFRSDFSNYFIIDDFEFVKLLRMVKKVIVFLIIDSLLRRKEQQVKKFTEIFY